MRDFEKEYREFIELISKRCFELGADISKYTVDHSCYRVSSSESYLKWDDKIVVKIKTVPLSFEATAEDSPEILVNN